MNCFITIILFLYLLFLLGYFLIEIRERLLSRRSIVPDVKEKAENTKF